MTSGERAALPARRHGPPAPAVEVDITDPPARPGARADEPVLAAKTRVPAPSGLVRERLSGRLAEVWQHRLTLVVAPAGSGKTTLLAQHAAASGLPVAWYRADGGDASAEVTLRYLEAALAGVLPELSRGARTVDELGAALDRVAGTRAMLVVDDLHALVDTPGEAVVARLVDLAPPALGVLVGSRISPGFPLSRLRLAGELSEITRDDLRFRSWEVERLFRDVYREPLAPVDLAALARRTDGWAAGLQLFHLATRDRRPDERRRVLERLDGRWRAMREYLTDNLLDQLPAALRTFLLETSVLPRLSGPLADALLGRRGSAAVLAELAEQQLFTDAVDDGWYRYHDVLRTHLEALLLERDGDERVRRRHLRAAALLEAAGQPADAVAAYCRAEDFAAVARLLGADGEQIASRQGAWLDRLPPSLLAEDPWVLLASARRHCAHGRWRSAVRAYREAEQRFVAAGPAEACRRERLALTVWSAPQFALRGDFPGVLRAATMNDPLAARRSELQGAEQLIASGVGSLLAGHVLDARADLEVAAERADARPLQVLSANVAATAAALLGGDEGAVLDLDRVQRDAERVGHAWLARVSGALLALSAVHDGSRRAAAIAAEAAARGDRWGAALSALIGGLGGIRAGTPDPALLDTAARSFAALDAATFQTWALAGAALARAATPGFDPSEVATAASEAMRQARAVGVDGAEVLACRALALVDPVRGPAAAERADALAAACGLDLRLPTELRQDGPDVAATPAPAALRLFGELALARGGVAVDLEDLRPRAKRVLRFLAVHAGRPVHREALLVEMWPEADRDTALRNLHVVLSQLRTALEPEASRGGRSLLVRDGDAYRLALPRGATVDLWDFDAATRAARAADTAGDVTAAVAAFDRALDLHADELLPEEGPAEWILTERERCRADASEAAQRLAELHEQRGDDPAAIRACVRGLRIDRYRDVLWRTLIRLHERAGNPAAASQARRRYAALLAELGIAT